MRTVLALVLVATSSLAQTPEDEALQRLLADEFDSMMRAWPRWASERGDRRFDDQLEDASAKARLDRLEHSRLRRKSLAAIDTSKLSERNRANYALLDYELASRLRNAKFHSEQMPISQQNGPQIGLPQMASQLSITTPEQFANYVARLEAVPTLIDQFIANMRAGLAAGRVPPRLTVAPTAAQARQHATKVQIADPSLHAMYPPFKKEQIGTPIDKRARAAITSGVIPAFARLADFLEKEYIPKCRETIGAADGIDGLAYYESRLRHHTTLPLTADEIHATGEREVRRIRAEMETLIRKHDLPHKDDFAAFVNFLRTDPRFYFTDKRDLLAGYRDICKRIDANMPALFGRLPRLPYGVREMPGFMAASAPTAYYYSGSLKNGIPGYFVANTFRLDQRPKYEMVSLTLHEAVPGHHHQNALVEEIEGQPEWRQTLGYTAFGEGWALYAERLGTEMKDVYRTPYDHFGRLSYEMWRAMRLVVDTGIHAKGWTRKQAVDFMLANSALTEKNVNSEVDRYIAWPGQATAYKIGELWIRRLRSKAESELGTRFDLRSFHDTVLAEGAIPLPVLEERINAWIASCK